MEGGRGAVSAAVVGAARAGEGAAAVVAEVPCAEVAVVVALKNTAWGAEERISLVLASRGSCAGEASAVFVQGRAHVSG